MRIKINSEPVGIVNLNLVNFQKIMKESLDLKKAYEDSAVLKYCKEGIPRSDLMEFVFLNTDWTTLLRLLKEEEMVSTELVAYECVVKGMTNYVHKHIEVQDRELVFEDKLVEKDTYYLIMDNNNTLIDKHVHFMLGQRLINEYLTDKEWKKVMRL